MGIFKKSQTTDSALQNYRRSKRLSARRDVVRQGLRMESLEHRRVFAGLSPVAVNDFYESVVDEPLQVQTGGVLANDMDSEGDSLSALEFLGPKHGELSFNPDGTFSYQPEAGFTGMDGFVYQVDDGTSQSQFAAVTIQVTDPNVAPTGENDIYQLEEDSVLTVLAEQGVLANDSDANGDLLHVELVDGAQQGMVELQADGSFSYTPDADFNGTDAFTYRISDGAKQSDLVVVELAVEAVNDVPIAQGEAYALAEDSVLQLESGALFSNDFDAESDSLEALLENAPEHGNLTFPGDGSFRYEPEADFFGSDSFSYRVTDGENSSELVTVELEVVAVQDAPQANNDLFQTLEDQPLEWTQSVLANDTDADGDLLTAEVVDRPEHGSLSWNPDGTFVFTPDPDFNGTDAFTYQVHDGQMTSDLAVVEIQVAAVNDAPITTDDAVETNENSPLTILAAELLSNDMDMEGDLLTAEIAEAPQHGTLEEDAEGNWVYLPEAGFFGTDQFSYMAHDGTDSSLATVSIVVNEIAQAPLSRNEAFSIVAGQTLSVTPEEGLLANDQGDPSGTGTLQAELFRGPQHGLFQLSPDGSFEYTPNADFSGIDSIIYRSTEGELESQLAVATLYVAAAPQIPVEAVDPIADTETGSPQETDLALAEDATPENIQPCEASLAEPVEAVEEETAEQETSRRDPFDTFFARVADDFWLEFSCLFS